MPSNIVLNARLRDHAAGVAEQRADAGLTPGAMARIIEEGAMDYLLGPAIGGDKKLRWDPSDVCPDCFTARAQSGACFCDKED